jgi:RND family efflux transporter MFP subunit
MTLLTAGCGKEPQATQQPQPRPVKMATATGKPPPKSYSAAGVVKAWERAELSFDRADVIVELPVKLGDKVETGDVLAKLNTEELETRQIAQQARFDEARTNYERIKRLFERNAVPRADLDRAEMAFQVAQAELDQLRSALERSTMKAPFSGRIVLLPVERFQRVQAQQTVMVLHDISRLIVEVTLPETFIAAVGQAEVRTHAFFDTYPEQSFELQVQDFSTEANPGTLTYDVAFWMQAPPDAVVLPGMSTDVTIEVLSRLPAEAADACWIPMAAVFSKDGQTSQVWKVDSESGTVQSVDVAIGATREGSIQILHGLTPGDTVATSGLVSLEQGQPVFPYVPDEY